MRASNLNIMTFTCAVVFGAAAPWVAHAAEVGNIEVCYNCGSGSDAANFFQGVQDGPIFEINNLTSTPLTSVMFTANGDTYNVGTISGLGSVLLIPGVSSAGVSPGDTSGFWAVTGALLDTSDSGPSANNTPFDLTALFGAQVATTGTFTPGTSLQTESNDGTVNDGGINFLGGPGNNDGPCNDCYGPDVVATINTANAATPLPAALPLFASGLGALSLFGCRRKRKNASPISAA